MQCLLASLASSADAFLTPSANATLKPLLREEDSPSAIAFWISATHLVAAIDITGWYCAWSSSSRS